MGRPGFCVLTIASHFCKSCLAVLIFGTLGHLEAKMLHFITFISCKVTKNSTYFRLKSTPLSRIYLIFYTSKFHSLSRLFIFLILVTLDFSTIPKLWLHRILTSMNVDFFECWLLWISLNADILNVDSFELWFLWNRNLLNPDLLQSRIILFLSSLKFYFLWQFLRLRIF